MYRNVQPSRIVSSFSFAIGRTSKLLYQYIPVDPCGHGGRIFSKVFTYKHSSYVNRTSICSLFYRMINVWIVILMLI